MNRQFDFCIVVQPQEVQLQQVKRRRNLWKIKGTYFFTSKEQLYQTHHQTTIYQLNTAWQTVEQHRTLMNTPLQAAGISSCHGDEGRRTVSGSSAYGQDRRCHTFYPQRRYHGICRRGSRCQRFWRLFPEKRTYFQTQFDRAEKNSLPDHEYTD